MLGVFQRLGLTQGAGQGLRRSQTILGSIRLWGLKRGIVGGAGKPVVQRLCGT